MGVDYYAYTVVGFKVTHHTTTRMICPISTPLEVDIRFCGRCGRRVHAEPITAEVHKPIPKTCGEYDVAYSNNHNNSFYVGIVTMSEGLAARTTLPTSMEDTRHDIVTALEASGFQDCYDPNSFGIYTILYCSY